MLIGTGAAICVTSFLFSFENVKHLAISIGIHKDIAPWISPTVDLSVVGFMVAVQWLALAGVTSAQLLPARRALVFAGAVMLLLNSAPSAMNAVADQDVKAAGRALVEAAVPCLLIIWTHVGPKVIRLFIEVREQHRAAVHAVQAAAEQAAHAEQLAAELADRAAADWADRAAAAERQAAADREDAQRRELLAAAARREEADRADRTAREQADRSARIELARAEAARAEADRTAAAAEADRARAEADRAAADRAAAEADRLAAEALRTEAAAAARPATRRTGTRTGPPHRNADRPGPVRPPADNVAPIADGATGAREALDKIRREYPRFSSWAELRTAMEGRAPSLNDVARTTGMGKARISRALQHAEDLGVTYRDPGDDETNPDNTPAVTVSN